MIYMIMMNLLTYSGRAALVKQELGDIYLYKNESFVADLYHYFEGDFLNFKLLQNDDNEKIIGTYDVHKVFSKEWNSSHEFVKKISIFSEFDSSLIVCTSGLNAYFFKVQLVTMNFTFMFKKTVYTEMKNASIISARIRENTAIFLVKGEIRVRGFPFSMNEFYYSFIYSIFPFVKVPAWDLNYLEEVSMNLQSLPRIAIWGKLEGKSIIICSNFIHQKIDTFQQINNFNRINSTVAFDLNVRDVLIYMETMLVIQEDIGIIIFLFDGGRFIQAKILSLSYYEPIYRFSKNNWQIASMSIFGVVSDFGIILIEFSDFSLVGSFKLESVENIQCEVLDRHLFVMSETENFLNVIKIGDNGLYPIYTIGINQTNGPITLIKLSDGYGIVKVGNKFIEFFNLQFTEKIIRVSPEFNTSITVKAADSLSEVNSTLNIYIISDLANAYNIYNYRKTLLSNLNQIVYLDETTNLVTANLSQVITGWNISFELTHSNLQEFDIQIIPVYPVSIISEQVYQRSYDHYLMLKSMYSIDRDGFYIDEILKFNDKNPKKLINGNFDVQILYENYIIFYNEITGEEKNRTYGTDCSLVFKFIEFFTFCADSNNLLIILDSQLYKKISMSTLIQREKLVDIGYIYNPNTVQDYLYILTESHVKLFYLTKFESKFKNSISIRAKFICVTLQFVYIIGDNIYIYDLVLENMNKVIPLFGTAITVLNNLNTLYIKTENKFLVFNGLAPIIQSLIYFQDRFYCSLEHSHQGIVFTVCEKNGILYYEKCTSECYFYSQVSYNAKNTSLINNGEVFSYINTRIITVRDSIFFSIKHSIVTYSLYLDFDESNFKNDTFMIDYDRSISIPLIGKIQGFNLDFELYVNNTLTKSKTDWVSLSPRIINNYALNLSEIIIDHEFIRFTDIIIFLTPITIEIYKTFSNYSQNEVFEPVFQYRYILSDILPKLSNCSSINYISTKGTLSLFVLICKEYYFRASYYDGSNQKNFLFNYFLTFITFDSKLERITYYTPRGINHIIEWIHVITSTPGCFILLCIDDLDYLNSKNEINNNLHVYQGTWNETITFYRTNVINFSTLGISKLQITCADGIYLSSPNCLSNITLYIYLTDAHFGLRMIKIQDNLTLVHNEIYENDKLISVGVCGNSLFVLSKYSYIDEYFIEKEYIPHFYLTLQPSYDQDYIGVNSVISCSSYYRTRYLAVYFYSQEEGEYELRLVDLKSNLYNSFFKFITFKSTMNSLFKGKSLFLNENLLTAIGGSTGEFYTFLISDLEIIFPKMTSEQYSRMKKKLKSSSFEVKILYKNEYTSKNSSVYLIHRPDPSGDDDDDSSDNNSIFWWLWIIVSIIAVFIILVTVILYKKFFGHKNSEKMVIKDYISMFTINRNARMTMMINSDITS